MVRNRITGSNPSAFLHEESNADVVDIRAVGALFRRRCPRAGLDQADRRAFRRLEEGAPLTVEPRDRSSSIRSAAIPACTARKECRQIPLHGAKSGSKTNSRQASSLHFGSDAAAVRERTFRSPSRCGDEMRALRPECE